MLLFNVMQLSLPGARIHLKKNLSESWSRVCMANLLQKCSRVNQFIFNSHLYGLLKSVY